MLRFREYLQVLDEGKYPNWLKVVVTGLSLRIRSLSKQIENEKDPLIQNKLIAKQNTLNSYISGLGIGVTSGNSQMIQKFKPKIGR
jgi:hypothetical protein